MEYTAEQIKERRAATRARLWEWANVPGIVQQLRQDIREREKVLDNMLAPRPAQLTGMPGSAAPGDPTGSAAIEYEQELAWAREDVDAIQRRIFEHQRYAAAVERCVMGLLPLECRVILLRYKEYGSAARGYWPRIARRMYVSIDHAKTLERMAVDSLADKLPEAIETGRPWQAEEAEPPKAATVTTREDELARIDAQIDRLRSICTVIDAAHPEGRAALAEVERMIAEMKEAKKKEESSNAAD